MMEQVDFFIGSGMNGIRKASDASDWLEKNMPNPPLPEDQRWDLFTQGEDDMYIRFYDEKDSVLFALKWI